jgi:hypothetical protein
MYYACVTFSSPSIFLDSLTSWEKAGQMSNIICETSSGESDSEFSKHPSSPSSLFQCECECKEPNVSTYVDHVYVQPWEDSHGSLIRRTHVQCTKHMKLKSYSYCFLSCETRRDCFTFLSMFSKSWRKLIWRKPLAWFKEMGRLYSVLNIELKSSDFRLSPKAESPSLQVYTVSNFLN